LRQTLNKSLMKNKNSTLLRNLIVVLTSISIVSNLAGQTISPASNFTYPQGVYNGEDIEYAEYPNGGKFNAALMNRIKLTQPVEPYTKEIANGVWALVGYHFGYKAVIEGEKGLIIYDTGDDIEEGQEIIELIRKFSDKPILTVIYSHAHYAYGTKAITDGVVRLPSEFVITTGSLPSITETQEFVVPKSIPIILLIIFYSLMCCI